MKRILVCGSRTWTNKDIIYTKLLRIKKSHKDIIFVHGGCKGADTICSQFCQEHNCREEIYKPNWKKYGKYSEPLRNQQMLETGIDKVIAFCHGEYINKKFVVSKGTNDTITRAKNMNIKVKIVKDIHDILHM